MDPVYVSLTGQERIAKSALYLEEFVMQSVKDAADLLHLNAWNVFQTHTSMTLEHVFAM
jgi:hypothetical protein